jgi:Na+-translocating ferredoxin:NAD+ oxidoreductase subunit B
MSAAAAVVDRIDALLPQTQCTRCGYAGCRPYAEAIAAGGADINRCPPGGRATVQLLATLTGRSASDIDPACGVEGPLRVAVIDETACIGCALCIKACPVDAIIGAAKRMHVVLGSLCSGCELCLPPCPVDCIELVPAQRTWSAADANGARHRYEARNARIARNERIAARVAPDATEPPPDATERERRLAAVAAAFERARARRAAVKP